MSLKLHLKTSLIQKRRGAASTVTSSQAPSLYFSKLPWVWLQNKNSSRTNVKLLVAFEVNYLHGAVTAASFWHAVSLVADFRSARWSWLAQQPLSRHRGDPAPRPAQHATQSFKFSSYSTLITKFVVNCVTKMSDTFKAFLNPYAIAKAISPWQPCWSFICSILCHEILVHSFHFTFLCRMKSERRGRCFLAVTRLSLIFYLCLSQAWLN